MDGYRGSSRCLEEYAKDVHYPPLLYVLGAEILARAIRENKQIKVGARHHN